MLSGETVTVTVDAGVQLTSPNGTVASVVDTDLMFANNVVVHVIDAVLLPADDDDMTSGDLLNVVDAIVANDDFSKLVEYVSFAGLVETVMAFENKTIFAPTNSAFETLEMALADADVDLSPDTVAAVLVLHVYDGVLLAADVSNTEIVMLSGETVTVTVDAGVQLTSPNGTVASVVDTDLMFANDVIVHVIDAVLLPED